MDAEIRHWEVLRFQKLFSRFPDEWRAELYAKFEDWDSFIRLVGSNMNDRIIGLKEVHFEEVLTVLVIDVPYRKRQ